MASPTVEIESATEHEEPLLLPEESATPASYPAADTPPAAESPAAASPTAAAAPEAPAKPRPSPEVIALNVLLRGELAAIETYRQALAKAATESGAEELRALESDHRDASGRLWHRIQTLGGEPVKSSGAWGAFAKAMEGAAKLFGNVTALAVLKEGEEHGAGLYRDALERPEMSAESRELVHPLLAKQQEHATALEGLIAHAGEDGR